MTVNTVIPNVEWEGMLQDRRQIDQAIREEKVLAVKEILERNQEVVKMLWDGESVVLTALKSLSGTTLKVVFEMLLEAGADLNAGEPFDNKPLCYAIYKNNPKWVEWLIQEGAEVKDPPGGKTSLLALAAHGGKKEVVSALIRAGACIENQEVYTKTKNTPLMTAVFKEHWSCAELLIKAGACVNRKGKRGFSPFLSAMHKAPLSVLICMKEHGAQLNDKNFQHENALIRALKSRNLETARWLLDQGVDVKSPDKHGHTPWVWAFQNQFIDLAPEFVKRGVDCHEKDVNGNNAVSAVVRGRVEDLKKLRDWGFPMDEPNRYGKTPLMIAVCMGREDMVKELLQQPLKVNQQDREGNTALMMACQKGASATCVRQLLEAGAEVTLNNKKGYCMHEDPKLSEEVRSILQARVLEKVTREESAKRALKRL